MQKKIIIHSFWFTLNIYLLVVHTKKNNNSFILVYFCQRSQAKLFLQKPGFIYVHRLKRIKRVQVMPSLSIYSLFVKIKKKTLSSRCWRLKQYTIGIIYYYRWSLFRQFFSNYLFISMQKKIIIHSFWSTSNIYLLVVHTKNSIQ
jgi:hypothetical protein